jgi:hypothetical protein
MIEEKPEQKERPKLSWQTVVKGAIPYAGAVILWPLLCLLIYLGSGEISVEQIVAVAGAVAVLMGIQRFSNGGGTANAGALLIAVTTLAGCL